MPRITGTMCGVSSAQFVCMLISFSSRNELVKAGILTPAECYCCPELSCWGQSLSCAIVTTLSSALQFNPCKHAAEDTWTRFLYPNTSALSKLFWVFTPLNIIITPASVLHFTKIWKHSFWIMGNCVVSASTWHCWSVSSLQATIPCLIPSPSYITIVGKQ